MDTFAQLTQLLKERILIIDGAMGSMIQNYKLTEADFRGERFKDHHKNLKGNNDLLVLTRPDVIKEIHAAYFAAGVDIVETNTFNGTSISQADYELDGVVVDLNTAAAKLARDAADEAYARDGKPRFVAGSIGPTVRALSQSPDADRPAYRVVSWQQMVDAFKEQARALLDADVDILEMCFGRRKQLSE